MKIKKYTDFLTEKEEIEKEEVKDIKKSPEKRDFEEDDNVTVILPTWNTY
jgi:hypothetical protein